MCLRSKALALTAVILAVTATAALAVTMNGDGTLIGTNNPDTIRGGNGNDAVYALLGVDKITVGNGNDQVDGDGQCQQGISSGVYSNPMSQTGGCSHGHGNDQGNEGGANGQGDNITTGNGNDAIWGGGGHNTIHAGTGDDTIYGGPLGDTIVAGTSTSKGADTIWLDYNNPRNIDGPYTGSTVTVDGGITTVHAYNGVKDTINCPSNNSATVYADKIDTVSRSCHKVIYAAGARDSRTVKHTSKAKHNKVHSKAKHSKSHK